MKRRVLGVLLAAVAVVGVNVVSVEAATVVRGGVCVGAATAQVRGTAYVCQAGVWQVVSTSVQINRGCTYRGELARNSGLLSCVPSGRVLVWKKANTYCNAANTFYNRANATYNQLRAQLNNMENQVRKLSSTDQATISAQISTVQTNLQQLRTLIRQDRVTLRQICSRV